MMNQMVYEFWDMRTNNLIDAFESEKEALMALLDVIKGQGDRAVEFLMLIEDDPDSDTSRVVGIGSELLDRARSAA
jgi:hypothetical protein